jgi:hypothetical protein
MSREGHGEFKKSDIPKAMGGPGVPLKRIAILVDDLLKNGWGRFEKRQVPQGEGTSKVQSW